MTREGVIFIEYWHCFHSELVMVLKTASYSSLHGFWAQLSFVFCLLQIKMEMSPKLFLKSKHKGDVRNEDAANVV